jgi:multisubunit Na+/H+ antiporter MnhG subunit
MLKWVVVVALAVIVLGLFAPRLAKLGLWRLPGDLRFTRNGRDYYLPITSTIILSALLTVIARVFHI